MGRLPMALGLAGLTVFASCALALHVTHWGDWPRYLSLFVREADGLLWPIALVGLGGGALATTVALRDFAPAPAAHARSVSTGSSRGAPAESLTGLLPGSLTGSRGSPAGSRTGFHTGSHGTPARLARMALACAAAAILLMVVFPTDRHYNGDQPTTMGGRIHDASALAAATLQGIAMACAAWAARRNREWRALAGRLAWPCIYATVAAIWLVLEATTTVAAASLLQRVVVALGVVWLLRLNLNGLVLAPAPWPHRHARAS